MSSSRTFEGQPVIGPVRAWFLHLYAFVLPVINVVFLVTGPHTWWGALLWTAPVWILVWIDNRSPNDYRQPPEDLAGWPFDIQVYALTAIQLTSHVLLGLMAMQLSWWPGAELGTTFANLIAVTIVSGTTAGYSGIVVAHEWMHRRKRHQFFLGRVLMGSVLYEHFTTEHIRGHHPRLGTAVDPATARYGEDLHTFFRRTVPAQFKSAWRLEKIRNGDENMSLTDRRMLGHRVLQGVVAQVLLLAVYFAVFGLGALVFFFMQARSAITLLETVNYIEHWGITRRGKTVKSEDSWDTDNWFTLHTLVGLSRHADHHAQASRPYQKLRYFDDTPKMPKGYYGTVVMALMNNAGYQEYAKQELRRLGLGPFREPAEDLDLGGAAPAPAE